LKEEETTMHHRKLFTAISSWLLLATLCSAEEPAKPTAERVKLVRQMYEKLPCEILGFAEPSKSVTAAFATDGGSIAITLVDASDKKLTMVLDRKLVAPARNNATNSS